MLMLGTWLAPGLTLAQSVVGTWLVTVEGIADNETRTLIISSDPASSGTGDLAAKYGLTSKSKTPVEAKLASNKLPRQLVVITQAATVITADEKPDGNFAGTFVTKGGKSYPVRIARVSEAELAQLQAPAASAPPSACAAFEGRWTGRWTQGGQGQAWLWVQAPRPNCSTRFAYVTEDREPRGWSTGQIEDGVLTFICNSSTGGVCKFKLVDNELWVSYSGSMGNNSAVFRRVTPP